MTTRQQLRRAVSGDRGEAARGISAQPAPTLPERLYDARERKGVDLYRAERDTKIRARYLGALERGDYRELPGAVYTKGFLRNYALYLGLDPDEVLDQWRRERGDSKEVAPVLAVPRPMAAPRKGLTFSPSLVVFALLTLGVLAFGAYLGVQLLRFAKPPTIAVTNPAAAVIEVDEATTDYTLRGTSTAGATISIATPGRDPYNVSADASGSWTAQVELRRGRNEFQVSSLDPDTGKRSEETLALFITVPFLVIEAPTLTVDQPTEGATFENGAIPVQGMTTNAESVVVSAAYMGSSAPVSAGTASPPPPAVPKPITATVAEDGTFTTPLELTAGQVGDHGHRVECRGQDPGPDAQRDGHLQGREPRGERQGRPGVAEGLGGRQDRRSARRGGQGRRQRQDADVHRQGVHRSPDGFVRRDVLHAQRHVARRPRQVGHARDLAVRSSGPTGEDHAALTGRGGG